MERGSTEPHAVPVEVLPPNGQAPRTLPEPGVSEPPLSGWKTFYHPASGVAILALDCLAFGTDVLTGFLGLILVSIISFFITLPVLLVIQLKWSRDTFFPALGKAFLGAFLVGLPFQITGTILGAAVIALAGLPHNAGDAAQKLVTASRRPQP